MQLLSYHSQLNSWLHSEEVPRAVLRLHWPRLGYALLSCWVSSLTYLAVAVPTQHIWPCLWPGWDSRLSGRGTEQAEGKRVCLGLPTYPYPSPRAPQAELVCSQPLNLDSQVPNRFLLLQLLVFEETQKVPPMDPEMLAAEQQHRVDLSCYQRCDLWEKSFPYFLSFPWLRLWMMRLDTTVSKGEDRLLILTRNYHQLPERTWQPL